MIITKKQGAMISLGIIGFYTFLYYFFVKNNTAWFYLTVLFFIGALAHFVRENRDGAQLRFGGAPTGVYWDAGYCLVPSILHILHNINIYLLWDLDEPESENSNISIDTYQDQRQSQYHVRANVSIFWLNVDKLVSVFLSWFFGFQKGRNKLLYQRIGFRIILVAIVIGWVCNSFAPKPKVEVVAPPSSTSSTRSLSEMYNAGKPGYTSEGRKLSKLLYIQEGSNVPAYLPFSGECIVIYPETGAIITLTLQIKRTDYEPSEGIFAFKNGVWEPRTWRDLSALTRLYGEYFPNAVEIAIPKSNTTNQTKQICF
mgnify:CR=1 FL=1